MEAFSKVLFFLTVCVISVELKPIDIEYSPASVLLIPSEIMSRVININDNPVLVQGFLATPDASKTTIRGQLNDNDVKTIFYNSINNEIPKIDNNVLVKTVTFDNRNNINKVPFVNVKQEEKVKSSYDVPLHSVEALPPFNPQEQPGGNSQIDVRFGEVDSQPQGKHKQRVH